MCARVYRACVRACVCVLCVRVCVRSSLRPIMYNNKKLDLAVRVYNEQKQKNGLFLQNRGQTDEDGEECI